MSRNLAGAGRRRPPLQGHTIHGNGRRAPSAFGQGRHGPRAMIRGDKSGVLIIWGVSPARLFLGLGSPFTCCAWLLHSPWDRGRGWGDWGGGSSHLAKYFAAPVPVWKPVPWAGAWAGVLVKPARWALAGWDCCRVGLLACRGETVENLARRDTALHSSSCPPSPPRASLAHYPRCSSSGRGASAIPPPLFWLLVPAPSGSFPAAGRRAHTSRMLAGRQPGWR
jgi:hypothetical protein